MWVSDCVVWMVFKGKLWDHEFDHSLRKISTKSSLAHRIGAYFESWVKLLGPFLSTSQTFREYSQLFLCLKVFAHMCTIASFFGGEGGVYSSSILIFLIRSFCYFYFPHYLAPFSSLNFNFFHINLAMC